MKRFVGMWLVIGAVLVGFVGLFSAFYALAALGAKGAVALGFPGYFGSSIVNAVTLMAVTLMTVAALLTVAERKWSAAMQDRIGANRILVGGKFALGGVPYLLADALKMLTKESIYPAARSKFLFELAPVLAFSPTFALFAVVPVGPEVRALGQTVGMWVANPDAGLLWIFALAGISVYGTTLAGWASNSRVGMLGAVRASAQMISYEVSLGLSLVGVMIAYRTVNLQQMAVAQGADVLGPVPALGLLLQPLGFLVFFTSSFAETKRAPFDLPEGESEIVGYFLEYSGMKFGLLFLAEFVEVVILAAVTTAVFLGGWHPVLFEGWLKANLDPDALRGGLRRLLPRQARPPHLAPAHHPLAPAPLPLRPDPGALLEAAPPRRPRERLRDRRRGPRRPEPPGPGLDRGGRDRGHLRDHARGLQAEGRSRGARPRRRPRPRRPRRRTLTPCPTRSTTARPTPARACTSRRSSGPSDSW